jgi:PKD repeat protein
VVGSPTANCVSNFSYLRTNSAPLTIAFNSSSSAGTTPADAIISRTWTFGDGSPALTGNNVYPSHTYPSIGNYQACLKITTASGCQKTICKTVSVYDSSCHANFNYNIGTGGVVYFNNTSSTLGTTAQYQWMFGNGTTSTAINPVKTYSPGTYTVCLVMWSASGCVDSVCKVITIAPPPPTTNCEAVFQYVGLPPSAGSAGYTLQFGSGASHGTSSTDSIIQRTWYWDDGMMTNGLVSPTHTYMMPGVYNVCLVITSASGCSDTTCKTIAVPMQNQLVCQSYFTYEHLPTTSAATRAIRFNSTMSHGGPADSITSRKWEFGDGTILTGNVVNPIHQYATPGTYNVCLTVKTALNCEKKICKLVVIPQVAGACVPHFSWQRTAPKQVSFNSSTSWVPVGDSIVERKWNFGDATPLLTGNVIAPVHNYLNTGVYTVSLKIKTAQNCEKTYYAPVVVQDSSITPPTTDPIKILSIFPNPAVSQTQTVVWSLHNNVQAEIAVYDIYGVKKWFVNKLLLQGNNITVVPTSLLLPGPYYLRVTTMYGVKSRIFFKQ